MKHKIKTMIAIIAIGTSLTACKHQIDQSVIQSFTNENKQLEQEVSDMRTFKIQIISERDKKQSEMEGLIDPNKKAAYEKDNTLKSELNETKDKMDIAVKVFEENYNSLTKSTESNTSFILSISDSEKNEDEIKSDWKQNMAVFNGMVESNNELQKKITGLSQEYNELTKQTIKKYGKTETTKNNIQKRKK